jgi:hypothetical protein
MKQCKKEEQQPGAEKDNLLLERLRCENNALNKLIKQLEERDPSKPKQADAQKSECKIPNRAGFDESGSE